tara:strand:- start:167 stop:466 length:300 start_codon:yes stop_codon:yes gene_type:complete
MIKSDLAEELSKELSEFLNNKSRQPFSVFNETKIFASAFLHTLNSLAIYIGQSSSINKKSVEITDLWGLSFCKISDFKKIYKKNIDFLEGISKKQKKAL